MARNKTEKLTISFERAELIKKLVGDIATKENRSLSAIIEKKVLDSILPENEEAKWIICQCLYGEDGGISETISTAFEINSAGLNGNSKYGNFQPLLSFSSKQEAFFGRRLTGQEEEIPHACSEMEALLKLLKRAEMEAEKVGDLERKIYYQEQTEWGTKILREFKENAAGFSLMNLYHLMTASWDVLKNSSTTYRLLTDITKMQRGWSETPENRLEIMKIIKELSVDWK